MGKGVGRDREESALSTRTCRGSIRRSSICLAELRFRTSYGQNVPRHSIEVAYLCQVMADELGLDGTLARQGGLLHGLARRSITKSKAGTLRSARRSAASSASGPKSLNAIAGHHGDVPATELLYAARRRGRRDQRRAAEGSRARVDGAATSSDWSSSKGSATGFGGVKQRARDSGRPRGPRHRRDADSVDDANAMRIAREIAQKVEADMTYPG